MAIMEETTVASDVSVAPAAVAPTAPAPEPANRDMAKHLADFESTPLFMRSLPDEEGVVGSNPELDALQSLLYEGPPNGSLVL